MSADGVNPYPESTHSPPPPSATAGERPNLLTWLSDGRLVLMDPNKEAVTPERWNTLPGEVRLRAESQFERVVRGSTKAAVLYLQ